GIGDLAFEYDAVFESFGEFACAFELPFHDGHERSAFLQALREDASGVSSAEEHDAARRPRLQAEEAEELTAPALVRHHAEKIVRFELQILSRDDRLSVARDGADEEVPLRLELSRKLVQRLSDHRRFGREARAFHHYLGDH